MVADIISTDDHQLSSLSLSLSLCVCVCVCVTAHRENQPHAYTLEVSLGLKWDIYCLLLHQIEMDFN